MKNAAIAYVVTAIAFLAIDSVWLTMMASRLYQPYLGHLLRPDFSVAAAGFFYVLYVAGIVYFAVMPALASGHWGTAAANGAMLGLVAYGTYDLTNQATLRDWPTIVTMADLCWGTLVTAAAATIAFLVTQRFA